MLFSQIRLLNFYKRIFLYIIILVYCIVLFTNIFDCLNFFVRINRLFTWFSGCLLFTWFSVCLLFTWFSGCLKVLFTLKIIFWLIKWNIILKLLSYYKKLIFIYFYLMMGRNFRFGIMWFLLYRSAEFMKLLF